MISGLSRRESAPYSVFPEMRQIFAATHRHTQDLQKMETQGRNWDDITYDCTSSAQKNDDSPRFPGVWILLQTFSMWSAYASTTYSNAHAVCGSLYILNSDAIMQDHDWQNFINHRTLLPHMGPDTCCATNTKF